MNIQELQEQIEELNTKIDEGKTVGVVVEQEGESAELAVHKQGDHSFARALAAPQNPADADAGLNLDMSAEDEISDAQIVEKINRAASGAEEKPGVPRVILTRDDANRVWVIVQDCPLFAAGHTITVRANDTTDLASIPRVFWAIIAPEELSLAAPVFHDLIYRCGGRLPDNKIDPLDGKVFTRRETDDLFRELMKRADIPRWKRTAAYLAVRSFGSFAWKG